MKPLALLVGLVAMGSSCSHMVGATPLNPGGTDPNTGVWVFVQSDDSSRTGVYVCREEKHPDATKPVCRRAAW